MALIPLTPEPFATSKPDAGRAGYRLAAICDRSAATNNRLRPPTGGGSAIVRAAVSIGFCGQLLCLPSIAVAQNASVLLPPVIDPEYNRDHNISVTEKAHPDYDPLGIRVGSFILEPSLTLAPVYTNNVYLDDKNKKQDVYANLLPYFVVDSDWSVHHFALTAAGDLRRYASQTLRNQNAWYVYSLGRIDISSDANVQVDAQIDRTYESPYFEDVVANLTAPSTYLRKFGSVKGTYQPGRARVILAADVSDFTFNMLRFADGATRDQSYRDRSVLRGSGVYEYALSPSISVYGQTLFDKTNYDRDLITNAQPNRDSTGFSIVGGANFDLTGFARGSFGIGFSRRSYSASFYYRPAQGVSAQAKIEFFPSQLTTFGLSVQRQLEDVSLSNSGAYWNNDLLVSADHELLDNMIVSASAEITRRAYLGASGHASVYQAQLSGRYQARRGLGFTGGISYGLSHPVGSGFGDAFHELRGTLGVRIRV